MGTILVVEDTQDSYDLIADALGGKYHLKQAVTGLDGIAQAISILPDLILLDMSLPELDGWQVVQQLRSTPMLSQTPVVALTAHAMKGDREECLTAGCSEYLSKPLTIGELVSVVEKYMAGSKAQECFT